VAGVSNAELLQRLEKAGLSPDEGYCLVVRELEQVSRQLHAERHLMASRSLDSQTSAVARIQVLEDTIRVQAKSNDLLRGQIAEMDSAGAPNWGTALLGGLVGGSLITLAAVWLGGGLR
jgi:RNA processing factor Prp31